MRQKVMPRRQIEQQCVIKCVINHEKLFDFLTCEPMVVFDIQEDNRLEKVTIQIRETSVFDSMNREKKQKNSGPRNILFLEVLW